MLLRSFIENIRKHQILGVFFLIQKSKFYNFHVVFFMVNGQQDSDGTLKRKYYGLGLYSCNAFK